MSLDKDLATLAKLYHPNWMEYNNHTMARESIGRKRWLMRCCGQRMNILVEQTINKEGLKFPEGSRARQGTTHTDCSICLRCGFIMGTRLLRNV
jgi:hypothetical protein